MQSTWEAGISGTTDQQQKRTGPLSGTAPLSYTAPVQPSPYPATVATAPVEGRPPMTGAGSGPGSGFMGPSAFGAASTMGVTPSVPGYGLSHDFFGMLWESAALGNCVEVQGARMISKNVLLRRLGPCFALFLPYRPLG